MSKKAAKKAAGRTGGPSRAVAPKWTVLVYMAAKDDPQLDGYAVKDLQEMQRATLAPDVSVRVQIGRHWPPAPQRYRIANGTATPDPAPVTHTNMGDRKALEEFLRWGLKDDEPGMQYFLILWGHAYGLGFGRDHGDPVSLNELRRALKAVRRLHGKPLELLGANACAISYAEAAFELRNDVRYLVASQSAVPFAGWPYQAILSRITGSTPPTKVGQFVIENYVAYFASTRARESVGMSLVDLQQVSRLGAPLGELTTALTAETTNTNPGAAERLRHIRAAFFATAAGDVRPLLDLGALCKGLVDVCADVRLIEGKKTALADLKSAAEALGGLVRPGNASPPPPPLPLPPQSLSISRTPRGKRTATPVPLPPIVLFHEQHASGADLNGLGIFAPFVTDAVDLQRLGLTNGNTQTGRPAYDALALMKQTGWSRLVFDVLGGELTAEIRAGIEGSGAIARADRSAVSQMIVSIDSHFDVLERTIAGTRAAAVPMVGLCTGGATATSGPGLGSPFAELRLFGPSQQRTALEASGLASAGGPSRGIELPVGAGDKDFVSTLKELETRLGRLERAVVETLTNGSFGLGPGRESDSDPKPGGGTLGGGSDPKPGGGTLGRGSDPKPGGGTLGQADTATALAATLSPLVTTAALFASVGVSLRNLESAAASIETIAATLVIVGPAATPGAVLPAARQLERTFDLLEDAVVDARRVLVQVLSHPACGFGPGPGCAEDRRRLARAGGLNKGDLALL